MVEGTLNPILQTRKLRLGFLKEFPKDKAGKWLEFSVATLSMVASYLFPTRQEDIFLTPFLLITEILMNDPW